MAARRTRTAARADAAHCVLINRTADNPDGQTRFAAFLQGLQEAGWAVGRNDRTTIGRAREGRDRPFDLPGVAHIDCVHLDTERRGRNVIGFMNFEYNLS
jgi:hypothetical protein